MRRLSKRLFLERGRKTTKVWACRRFCTRDRVSGEHNLHFQFN